MKKVSFDFDSTLSQPKVQLFAKELIEKGIEVWICTSRMSHFTNTDLFTVADELNIKREHIIFTNMKDKIEELIDKDFIFHLDDDELELELIDQHSNIIPIHITENNDNWLIECKNALSH
jgi:hypothetical protein